MKKKNPRIGGIGVRVEKVMITNFTLLRGQGEGRGCMGEGVVFRFRELYFLRFSDKPYPPLPPFFVSVKKENYCTKLIFR